MNTLVTSVITNRQFMKVAVELAQHILRSEQTDDITAIHEHGAYVAEHQPVPPDVWRKSIPAFGRATRSGKFSRFVELLRAVDAVASQDGEATERFENTVAKLVFRHTRTRR